MAVPMHPIVTASTKGFADRAIAGTSTKMATLPHPSQKSPSRPASTAPNTKADTERTRTPLGEGGLNIREEQAPSSLPTDTFRRTPVPSSSAFITEGPPLNQAIRASAGGNSGHGFMPAHPYLSPTGNMNVGSQQGYPATPPMQFYAANYPPNAFPQNPNATRPNSAIPKYQNMDPKFVPAANHINHSTAPPPLQSGMTRRHSNYFVAPSMSPVQTTYGPRGWIPGNAAILPGPVPMQNGNGSMQNPGPTMYQPAMIAAGANPALLTPPGGVQPNYAAFAAPPGVSTASFGYPTPGPESTAVVNPDIPPPIPSIYPDPTYSNINNCLYNPKGTTNVYIRGLRPETTDEDLLHMVRGYGVIISTKAIIDTQTNSCKG